MKIRLKKQTIIDLSTTAITGVIAIAANYRVAAVAACAVVGARAADYFMDTKALKEAAEIRPSSGEQSEVPVSKFTLSDEQGRVIDFLASHYDTLCFGDTDHASCSNGVITSESLQQRLAAKNAKATFIEKHPFFQELIGMIESGEVSPEIVAKVFSKHSSYESLSSSNLHYRLLAEAIAAHPGQFRAIDSRDMDGIIPLSAKIMGEIANTAAQILFPKRFPKQLGHITTMGMSRIVRGNRFLKELTDDTNTVHEICKQITPGELCSIEFGDGHFTGVALDFGGADMVTALKALGRNPVVINLVGPVTSYKSYKTRYSRKKVLGKEIAKYKHYRPADIVFVFEKDGAPGKVVFNNKALEEAYRNSAKEHHETPCLPNVNETSCNTAPRFRAPT